MENITIQIRIGDLTVDDCTSLIAVPELALTEPGYITTVTAGQGAHSKHEFQAMAQMAYYQYQDDELDIKEVADPIVVTSAGQIESIESGMVIYRDHGGEFHVYIHAFLNKKKMLEATNRYCTRWVRLDI